MDGMICGRCGKEIGGFGIHVRSPVKIRGGAQWMNVTMTWEPDDALWRFDADLCRECYQEYLNSQVAVCESQSTV